MVYREHALNAPEHVDDNPDRSLARLDASGRPGAAAVHGRHGADGRGSGADGAPGGDARKAGDGQAGGRLFVTLEQASEEPPTVRVSGRSVTATDVEQALEERVLPLDAGGFVDLVSVGGRGGAGGRGGDGGSGARGRAGRDATRHRSGGDGGPGGDGGHGGRGSSGGRGGDGGQVQVTVDIADTHLLMLLRADVSGGSGGPPGQHGAGGAAGAGGPGGDSYSWTTTESGTDSDGNPTTRTRHHRNPGGSRGRPGSAGDRSTLPLVAGEAGRGGQVEVAVRDEDGNVETYADRYRPRLVGFAHVSANEDGVYEPLERIEVSGVTVLNDGGMPTPRDHDITLSLESRGWVWPDEDASLRLPRSLAAGETAAIPGSLFFSVGDQVPEGPSDPLGIVDYITHRAELPAAHRAFRRYHRADDPKGRFVVRHPVGASAIEALPSLAPGEATRVRFELENVSGRALGEASEQARELRFRLRPNDSGLGEHAQLLDDDDQPVPFEEGWVEALPTLEGQSKLAFEATLAIAEDAPLYERATYWLSLELAPPPRDGVAAPPRAIQHRAFEVTVAARYRRVEGCELLLVANHLTTREQMLAWTRLAERAGLPMAVWDVSLEGHLDFAREVDGAPLLEHIRGGTVVVLDAPMPSPMGALSPHRLLDRDQVQQLVDASISVLIFGGVAGDVPIERWLVSGSGTDATAHHENPLSFRASLAAIEGAGEAPVHESIDVHHVGLWFEEPEPSRLEARASRLAAHLADEYPHRRFVVDTHYAPELEHRYGPMCRWRLGRVEVRSTLSASRSHVVHAAEEPDVASLSEGGGTEALVRVARDFDGKLDELRQALMTGRDALPDVEAILVDLAMEQSSILARGGGRRGLSSADLDRSLPMLDALVAHAPNLPPLAKDDWRTGALVELAARLGYLTRAQPRWWEWALYPLRRAPMLRTATRRRLDAWVIGAFGPHAEHARERISTRIDEIEQGREEASDAPADARDHARRLLREPLDREGVTSDAEAPAEVRVVDAAERESIAEAAADDERRRHAAQAEAARAREKLLRRRDANGGWLP